MLSYANIYAGAQVLLMESCLGIVTGAVAQRMAGYGKILSVYTSQQPAWADTLKKFNLTFAEHQSIKWVHSGDIFGVPNPTSNTDGVDVELQERLNLHWPCPLQDHTRKYLEKMSSSIDQADFLSKRCSRFARKLTRHTAIEANSMLTSHLSDSLLIASKYDPTETLLHLLPYLAASCPFVIFYEYMEPLAGK
jgi:tRNA (adenine-N(1)-)-methyltransferase non-catalytic subunit